MTWRTLPSETLAAVLYRHWLRGPPSTGAIKRPRSCASRGCTHTTSPTRPRTRRRRSRAARPPGRPCQRATPHGPISPLRSSRAGTCARWSIAGRGHGIRPTYKCCRRGRRLAWPRSADAVQVGTLGLGAGWRRGGAPDQVLDEPLGRAIRYGHDDAQYQQPTSVRILGTYSARNCDMCIILGFTNPNEGRGVRLAVLVALACGGRLYAFERYTYVCFRTPVIRSAECRAPSLAPAGTVALRP